MSKTLMHNFALIMSFSSPSRQYSPWVEFFRGVASSFLSDIDTSLTELAMSLEAMVVAYQVIVLHDQSTPFLSSALSILHFPIEFWALLLQISGLCQIFFLATGFRNHDCLKARSIISAVAALVWFFTVCAIITTIPFVFASVLRYLVSFAINGIMYLSLSVKWRYSLMDRDSNDAKYRAVP